MTNAKHILVLGAGSVGRRHLKNFSALGFKVSAYDPREDRLQEAAKETKLENSFTLLENAMKEINKFDGAVIASPPKFHISQAKELLKFNIPLLLEKPLAKTLDEAETLAEILISNKTPVLLGYTYRWWPSIIALKQKIAEGEIGKTLRADFFMSAHLADWHPWERYQDFFMASRELGGGALLDESHWLDLMIWFFGMPAEIFADISKISNLEIDTDDNVELIARYDNGLRVNMHLDLYGRPHKKYISVTGDKGSLEWNFETNLDRNIMFVGLAKDFAGILNGAGRAECTVEDGIKVLKVIETARESSKTGKLLKVT